MRLQKVLERLIRSHQGVIDVDFRVAQHHSKFRSSDALLARLALLDLDIVGQVFQITVEQSAAFKSRYHARDFVHALERAHLAHAERLSLQVVIAQHEPGDVIGHRCQKFVAFLPRQAFFLSDVAEQDFDIYLAVRSVDASGVVDEVGIDTASVVAEFNPGALCQAEVATFSDDLAVELVGIDADVVIAAVADIGVTLRTCLYIRTDAAVPKQVRLHAQDGRDQHIRLHCRLIRAEHFAHFLAQADRLGLSGKHTATLRYHGVVVVGPTRPAHAEQSLALLEARGHIGVGIEENMQVVECSDELDLARQQHAVSEHIAAHVSDTDHRKRVLLRV